MTMAEVTKAMGARARTKNRAPAAAVAPPVEPADADMLKLENQLCFPLYAAARMVVNAYRPVLAELGLTYPQYIAMLVLWESDGLSVTAVGDRLHLDSGTLTPVLKRLEALGLLARKRDPSDDRIVGNWVTPAGVALKARAVDVPMRLLCAAKIELEEIDPMKKVLERLIEALLPLQPSPAR